MNATETFSRLAREFTATVEALVHDLVIWLGRLSTGERVVLFSAFILLILTLMIHRDINGGRKKRSIFHQFGVSMIFILFVSFGAGWYFDGHSDHAFLNWFD